MNKNINKLLIANRGEVAFSIIKTAQSMGMKTVAVYEKPDSGANYIHLADTAVMIGEGPVKDYLNIDKMILAAHETGADAIHPGYGFLAERADFAAACEKNGLIFIGPPAQVMKRLGDKAATKAMMKNAEIATVPGTGILSSGEDGVHEILTFAEEVGYPILLKAVGGGGELESGKWKGPTRWKHKFIMPGTKPFSRLIMTGSTQKNLSTRRAISRSRSWLIRTDM